jgi:hypothetical protein
MLFRWRGFKVLGGKHIYSCLVLPVFGWLCMCASFEQGRHARDFGSAELFGSFEEWCATSCLHSHLFRSTMIAI